MSKIETLKNQIIKIQEKAYGLPENVRAPFFKEIIHLYEELIPLEKNPYFSIENKARTHYILKQYDEAIQLFLQTLELHPTSTPSMTALADLYTEIEAYDKALFYLDSYIKNTFGNVDFIYLQRSKINQALGNLEEAAKDKQKYDTYQTAEQAKWDDPNHYYNYK